MLAEGHPNEILRAAVASALTRLLRHTPALLTHLLATHGPQLLINGECDISNNPHTSALIALLTAHGAQLLVNGK